MGEGMSRRMIKQGIETVGYRRNYDKAKQLQEDGGISEAVDSLETLVRVVKRDKLAGEVPGIFQLVIPAELVEETINELLPLLGDGDIVIDHGNSNFKDSRRRAIQLEKGIQYLDCGTSGGVYGLERGFCLMVGGADLLTHIQKNMMVSIELGIQHWGVGCPSHRSTQLCNICRVKMEWNHPLWWTR